MKAVFFSFGLILIIFQSNAQDGLWQPGYIVFKNSTDTLFGYTGVTETIDKKITKVWFRKDKNIKKGTLKFSEESFLSKDTLRFFTSGVKKFKYINYTDKNLSKKQHDYEKSVKGWVEMIDVGAINLCLGFSSAGYRGGSSIMMPAAG
ncbi:MAG: hypothetical protein H0W84_09010, partial [Bacteroidetes bacterium]|nr:hypothetical protein [Bacteroidota bacterium]